MEKNLKNLSNLNEKDRKNFFKTLLIIICIVVLICSIVLTLWFLKTGRKEKISENFSYVLEQTGWERSSESSDNLGISDSINNIKSLNFYPDNENTYSVIIQNSDSNKDSASAVLKDNKGILKYNNHTFEFSITKNKNNIYLLILKGQNNKTIEFIQSSAL